MSAAGANGGPRRSDAGIITRVRLENFMCHSSLTIELGDWVNFITGQNGSGKSAILTALCVAFGCRAKGTQRAATLKDFIKTGCSYATIVLEIKNQGGDAFLPELYGNLIILERRITESGSSITLRDHQGRKVAQKRDDLQELVEHFNIDVENPCVIMTQDKSREFLHSGNSKDKFKFFFKSTLLQQVSDLLDHIRVQLINADSVVQELEKSIQLVVREVDELKEKIKNMEHVEEIAQELLILKKKLAWSWVYHVDNELKEHSTKLTKLKDRIPACQEKIDKNMAMAEEVKRELHNKRAQANSLTQKTSEVRRMKNELQHKLSMATKDRLEHEEEYTRVTNVIKKMAYRVKLLKQQSQDIFEKHNQLTQAEDTELEDLVQMKQQEIAVAISNIARFQDEENAQLETLSTLLSSIEDMSKEIELNERRYRDLNSQIRDLEQRQRNKVTAFGGERVLNLLRSVERHERKFRNPPIGPIGAHVNLVGGESWAVAVDCAIGKILDAFIVTNHKDLLLLRECAKEASYHHLQIIIYDFSAPLLKIPDHLRPLTKHATILSVLHSDNPTVLNVLIDMGHVERQVLVQDYDMGKSVAFEQRIQNMKEVYTADGYRMFYRGSVQTTLPPYRRSRTGRLCSSLDERITDISNETAQIKEVLRESTLRKRKLQDEQQNLNGRVQILKRRRLTEQQTLEQKRLELSDIKNSISTVDKNNPGPNMDELSIEISQVEDDIQQNELVLQKITVRMTIAEEEEKHLRSSFQNLCESIRDEVLSIDAVEKEVSLIEEKLQSAEQEKTHYEGIMVKKVLPDIKEAESKYEELQRCREENFGKASMICQESEVEALGGVGGATPEQLSNKINKLKQIFQQERGRHPESIDDLRAMHDKKSQKILERQQLYAGYREKLDVLSGALERRWNMFQRNACYIKRQLTWHFNMHLGKKGISGHIMVDYEKKHLSVEVKMPQDASGSTVKDTRGLSGGERSFSTLCFALALHAMTEAPFRAMDEFDVFMDAVSRKISLETLVEYAVGQGSQWIFITPHDISAVKATDKVKKQQMAAPRG